jgi:hypothetical protein
MRELSERIGKPIQQAGPLLEKRDPTAGNKLKKLAKIRG